MPPVKIASRGVVREDILRWIRNQVRDPLVALDVKGQIASLNSGRRRVLELYEQWGEETVEAAMRQYIDYAREKLEARLAELPDGQWREVQYIDHDGHDPEIYKIVCTTHEDRQAPEVRLHGHESERARLDQLHLCRASGRLPDRDLS